MQALPADRYQSADEMLHDIERVQRAAYKPAGQTELKRWLAELQERDHCPTISLTASAQSTTAPSEAFDIGEGAEVVFDESDLLEVEDILRGMQPTIAAVPEPLVASDASVESKTKADIPAVPKRARGPARAIFLASILAALALGAWFYLQRDERAPTARGRAAVARETSVANKVERKEAAKPEPTPIPVVAVVAIDAGIVVRANTAAPVPPAEAEGEEEKLLKNADPDDRERVLGEDEGIQGDKPKSSKRASPLNAEPASVRVVSTPEGAVVSLGKRVFGRAPMNLRFRPGITFELTFVKHGYLPKTKRFTATGKKAQTVAVTLKRKPEARKSLFRRIFGGK
jgi:hypothetical protein